MPQIVPVSDFRANVKSVSRYTDCGEVVVLTQNGKPKWAMIDYEEWNAAASMQERAFKQAILETEEREKDGQMIELDAAEARRRLMAHRASRG